MSDIYILTAGLGLTGAAIGLGLYARLRQNRRAQEAERAAQAETARREAAAERMKAASVLAHRAVSTPPPDAPVQWTVTPPAVRQPAKTKSVLPGSDPSRWPPPLRKRQGEDIQASPLSPSPKTWSASPAAPQPVPETVQRYAPPPLPPPQAPFSKADLRRAKRKAKHPPGIIRNALAQASETISARALSTVAPSPQPRTTRTTIRPAEAHHLRGTKYQLTYSDGRGEITERKIRFERTYDRDGTLSLIAHCYMRKEQREFRTDRIIEIIDAETGMVIRDPEAFFA